MKASKQFISQFRQWQQNSKLHIAQPSDEQHHCPCCENAYTGNFCPQCGQKAGVKRITWASIRSGVMDLWGMGTRSLPYTLWQLLLRPGYLIGDYISGRRQVSFPPIKMLVFVALFVYLVNSFVSPEEAIESSREELMLDYVFNFFETHYDVAAMFFFSMLIVPTYFIFRFAPRYDHHTLPEGFFIQVFNSTLALLFLLVYSVFELLNISENLFALLMALAVVFVVYRSYHQLFGYSHWSTSWRVVAVCASAVLSFMALILIDLMTRQVWKGDYLKALKICLVIIIPLLLVTAIVIAVSYFISRRTAKCIKPTDE